MQCLIIDDDPDDQEIFLMCVRDIDRNIICITSNSALEAISLLDSKPNYIPEFIFIDVNMPKMNGIACLDALKKMNRLRNSQLYMYSTTADPVTSEASKKLGAEGFIIKPVRIAELKQKLTELFSKRVGNS